MDSRKLYQETKRLSGRLTIDDDGTSDQSRSLMRMPEGSLPSRSLSFSNHIGAVIVFGQTQAEADARATMISTAYRSQHIRAKDQRKRNQAARKGGKP